MNSALFRPLRTAAAALLAAAPLVALAQGFAADYELSRFASPSAESQFRLAPAVSSGGDGPGAGLSLQAGRNWYGQVALAQGSSNALSHGATADVLNLGGGFRWADGQSLSLQVSRGRGLGQRLGLSVNYDWPRYFVRLSYDPGLNLTPQDSLRFSAGVRF